MESRLVVCQHGRSTAGAARRTVDFKVQRAQAQAILDSRTMSASEKRVAFNAVLAGAVFDDLPGGRRAAAIYEQQQRTRHAPMPALALRAPEPVAHASGARTAGGVATGSGHALMPAIVVRRAQAGAEVRSHAARPEPRRLASGHYAMPGLSFARTAR